MTSNQIEPHDMIIPADADDSIAPPTATASFLSGFPLHGPDTHTPDTTDSLVASELHNAGAMPQASFCQANAGQTAQQSKTPGMRATPGQHDALDVLQESTMQSLPISDHEENVNVCVVKEPKSIAPIMLV